MGNYDWVKQFIKDAPNIDSVSTLSPYMGELYNMMLTGRLDAYDMLLSVLDVSNLNTLIMVSLLRTSCMYHKGISSYQQFLNDSAIEIKGRGEDVARILVGLPYELGETNES